MEQTLKHTRGDTFIKTVLFETATGPINLTGCTVKFSIKDKVTDSTHIVSVNADIPNPTDGKANIQVAASSMKLDLKSYFYDIQITDSAGIVTTPVKGPFIISYDIT